MNRQDNVSAGIYGYVESKQEGAVGDSLWPESGAKQKKGYYAKIAPELSRHLDDGGAVAS
jgi:hypothetical protein